MNDTHGHKRGDAVLSDVAYEIRKSLRSFELVYRIGGEEFLVLLPGVDLTEALEIGERVRHAVQEARPGSLDLTLSAGVATGAGGHISYEQLFREADAALFEAKRAGRNRVETAGGLSRLAFPGTRQLPRRPERDKGLISAPVILLTGATGTVGSALLRRLTADGRPVRALVRDQRRLGDQRVRVQIALGDLSDPPSFRNALRGVHTVVHLAASIRDQPRGSIEELNAVATLRLVRAAERAGVERFVFFSAMNAHHHSRTRFFRAKALAEEAVEESSLSSLIFKPSIIYTPGDPWLTLLDRLSRLPAVPVSGSGKAPVSACLGGGRGGGRRQCPGVSQLDL